MAWRGAVRSCEGCGNPSAGQQRRLCADGHWQGGAAKQFPLAVEDRMRRREGRGVEWSGNEELLRGGSVAR